VIDKTGKRSLTDIRFEIIIHMLNEDEKLLKKLINFLSVYIDRGEKVK